MRALPDTPLIARADLRRTGWSDSAISRAVSSGRLHRVRRGHFAADANIDHRLLARAAARVCSGSVISHRSAALMHGLALLEFPPDRPDLTVPPGGTGDVAGALLHRAGLPPEHVVLVDGHPVTSPARTAIDVARASSVGAGVVTIDSALNSGRATASELAAVIERCANWPGILRANTAYDLADGAAESALESISRLALRRMALPAPRSQAVIRDGRGRFVARSDFYWDEFGVVGEADGRSKYDDRDVLVAEKLRQEALENLGLICVRWGWTDVRSGQAQLRRRVRDAFERGRLRDASGFPRRWSVDDPPAAFPASARPQACEAGRSGERSGVRGGRRPACP